MYFVDDYLIARNDFIHGISMQFFNAKKKEKKKEVKST